MDNIIKAWERAMQTDRALHQVEYDATHPGGWIGASTLGDCLRAAMYGYNQTPQTNPADEALQLRFDLGHYIEDYALATWQRHIDTTAEVLVRQAEARLAPFVAHTDALYTRFGEQPVAIEIKSLSPYALDRAKAVFTPYPAHQIQLSTFIRLKQLLQHPISEQGLIIYVALDGRRRYFTVDVNTWRSEVDARLEALRVYVSTQTLPERLDNPTVFPCKACFWHACCWNNGN